MKNKKSMKKTILLSAITAIAFGSIAVTTSYALFTDSAETNVTVTAGKVDVSASASDPVTYSMGETTTTNGTFTNGGTAVINGSSITLDKVSPGDKVTFKLAVTNSSTIATKYRISLLPSKNTGLFDGLKLFVGGMTTSTVGQWIATAAVTTATEIASYTDCYIELPKDAGDEYQGKSCVIDFKVEAVQGNAAVTSNTIVVNNTSEAQAALDGDISNKTIYFKSGTYDELYIKPTANASTDTQYYNSQVDYDTLANYSNNKVDSASELTKDNETKHGYVRTIENVTFIGEKDVKLTTITPKYADSTKASTDPVTGETINDNNGYTSYVIYDNLTFMNLSFTEQFYLGNWMTNPDSFRVSDISITNCNFYSASDYAMQIGAYYGRSMGNFTIKNSTFQASTNLKCGIYMKHATGNFDFEDNIFKNCGYNAIQLTEDQEHGSKYKLDKYQPNITMTIKGNVFEKTISNRALRLGGCFESTDSSILVEDNIFNYNGNSQLIKFETGNDKKADGTYPHADADYKAYASNVIVSVGTNTYYDNEGNAIENLTVVSDSNKKYFAGCVDKA